MCTMSTVQNQPDYSKSINYKDNEKTIITDNGKTVYIDTKVNTQYQILQTYPTDNTNKLRKMFITSVLNSPDNLTRIKLLDIGINGSLYFILKAKELEYTPMYSSCIIDNNHVFVAEVIKDKIVTIEKTVLNAEETCITFDHVISTVYTADIREAIVKSNPN